MASETKMHELIIIGAGPAGLTAALYAGRYRIDTLLLEKVSCGGQIVLSERIDNYPGFPGGIVTEELIKRFSEQAADAGVSVYSGEVTGILREEKSASFIVKTPERDYSAKAVLVCSGARPKTLGIKNEDRLTGRGVSYCGTCDGPLFRNKEIAVIGGGDRALEEAIFLSKYAGKLSLIHRRSEFRGAKILQEKIKSLKNVELVLESSAEEVLGDSRVEGLRVKNKRTGALREIGCQGVFIFVGIAPNTAFLNGVVDMDEQGFIVTDRQFRASAKGIFACGDCLKKDLYQVINACGEAAVAAHMVQLYLMNG